MVQRIHDDIREFLTKVRQRVPLAVVGGSDLAKIIEQLGDSKDDRESYQKFRGCIFFRLHIILNFFSNEQASMR